MTDREKMIEEIARLICENEKPCYDCLKCTIYDGKICCKYLRIAKKIVNLLIPKGAVVLTKEDMKKYAKDCIIGEIAGYDILNGLISRAERQREQVRKETAMEILLEIINKKEMFVDSWEMVTEIVTVKEIKMVAEKYGVEVEE